MNKSDLNKWRNVRERFEFGKETNLSMQINKPMGRAFYFVRNLSFSNGPINQLIAGMGRWKCETAKTD